MKDNTRLATIPLAESGPHRQRAIAIRPNYPGTANVEALLKLFRDESQQVTPN